MPSRAKVKRQDQIDAEASPNISMQRLASSLERQQRSQQVSRILIFLFVLTWLSLLFGRSLMRQGAILDKVYDNAAKDNRIQQLRMSNAQLQEEIYSRTDLQAIAQAAIELGMVPSLEAPRILIPQTKNDEVLLRLESADAESFLERSQTGRETYYNLEEYYEKHRLAQAYFSDYETEYAADPKDLVANSYVVNEDGGIILDGNANDSAGDASAVEGVSDSSGEAGVQDDREATVEPTVSETTLSESTTSASTANASTANASTAGSTSDNANDELEQADLTTEELSPGEGVNEVVNE